MTRRTRSRIQTAIIAVVTALSASVASAQITLDGTLGPAGPLAGPAFVIPASAGTTRGTNLFHSFGQFNVNTGQSATFTGPSGIENVVGRVTGGQQSFIDGLVRSSISGANLFLLNPSGILFGPNATLDVSGSFHASTAHYLAFADGTRFLADASVAAGTSLAQPAAFGFLGPAAASLVVQGSQLQVPEGKTLSLVAGNVELSGATLTAPSGRLQIAAVASAGEVGLGTPEAPALDTASFTALGRVDLVGSTLDVSDVSGLGTGTVVIRGGQLFMGGSRISVVSGDVETTAPGVDIAITGDAVLTSADGLNSEITTTAFGVARGADVAVTAGALVLDEFSFISTTTWSDGNGGTVSVLADTVTLSGGAHIDTVNQSFGVGTGGDLNVTGRQAITLSGFFTGIFTENSSLVTDGGRVEVSTARLTIDADAAIATRVPFSEGRGGDVVVTAARIDLLAGGNITSRTEFIGPGGNILVTATDALTAAGQSAGPSGVFAGGSDVGVAGDIVLDVGNLSLLDGSVIQSGDISNPFSTSLAGGIRIDATGTVLIGDRSRVSSQASLADVAPLSISAGRLIVDGGAIEATTVEFGRAGDIAVSVTSLWLRNGGQIATSTALGATNDAGNITIAASESVDIAGAATDGVSRAVFSNDASSGLFSTTDTPGAGGDISVTTGRLAVSSGGKISVAATGDGAGGSINVTAGSVDLASGGSLIATSTGAGNAGDIVINAGSVFTSRDSTVTTSATDADGGNIEILASQRVHFVNSEITTSVESGTGKGGNITIDPHFVILDNSRIRADAFGGPGGNVQIVADVFLTTESVVSASSALGTPGTVNVQAEVTDVSGGVTPLPEGVLQAAALLRASCAARLTAGKASSLVVAGRSGVPLEPRGLLPSPLPVDRVVASSAPMAADFAAIVPLPRLSLAWLDPDCSK